MLSQIMLMFDERLSEFQRTKGSEILCRAKLGDTGQNLVWQAEVTARRAVLQRDEPLLRRAFALIASEIRISETEGIQADLSFHQHGHCLYNHGYGAGFAVDNARLASLTAGTSCEYPPAQLELLAQYILDGSQWLAHGAQSDFGAEGREITRPNQTAAYLGSAAQYMLQLPTGRDIVAIETASLDLIRTKDLIPGTLPPGMKLGKKGHLFERLHAKDPHVVIDDLAELGHGVKAYALTEVE